MKIKFDKLYLTKKRVGLYFYYELFEINTGIDIVSVKNFAFAICIYYTFQIRIMWDEKQTPLRELE